MILLFTLITAMAHANPVERLAPDFFLRRTSVHFPKRVHAEGADCRSTIAQRLCLTDAGDPSSVDVAQRICHPGAEKYAPVFEALHNRFPKYLSKMFCYVEKIYIEPKLQSVAYATMATDPEGNQAAYVGVGLAYLVSQASLDTIMSWKEQINFGGPTTDLAFSPMLPVAHTSLNGDFVDTLYYVLSHEFGHVFDFANGFDFEDGGGKWARMSFRPSGEAIKADKFPLDGSLCFYDCAGRFLSADQQDDVYKQLSLTNFTSAYSTVNAFEDFAESFAIYTLKTQRPNPEFKIVTHSGYTYDLIAKMDTARMQSKARFIQKFLSGRMKYPGQF